MTRIRNRSLQNAFRRESERELKAGRAVTKRELLKRVIDSPVTDGYFVGVDHAVAMVRMQRKNGLPATLKPEKQKMWNEISAKVGRRIADTGCDLTAAVSHVLSSATASGYFISPETARKLTPGGGKEAAR